jgi:hypothetical protein
MVRFSPEPGSRTSLRKIFQWSLRWGEGTPTQGSSANMGFEQLIILEKIHFCFTSLFSFVVYNFFAQNAAYSLQHLVKKNRLDKLNMKGKQDPSRP